MTTKEATYIAKKTSKGVRAYVNTPYGKLSNVLDNDNIRGYKLNSQNNFENAHKGIYTFYDQRGEPIYSMCFQDKAQKTIYQMNIKDIELGSD